MRKYSEVNVSKNRKNKNNRHPLEYDSSTANENVRRSKSRNVSQWKSRVGGRFVVVVDGSLPALQREINKLHQ